MAPLYRCCHKLRHDVGDNLYIPNGLIILIMILSSACSSENNIPSPSLDQPNYRYEDFNNTFSPHIIADVIIHKDTVSSIFDTGGIGLVVDQNYACNKFALDSIEHTSLVTLETVYFPFLNHKSKMRRFFHNMELFCFNDTLTYDNFFVYENLRKDFGYDILFSVPKNDTHVWHFDFKNQKIELSKEILSDSLIYDFVTPVVRDKINSTLIFTEFPLSIYNQERKVIDLIMDTGVGYEDIIISASFNSHDNIINHFSKDALLTYRTNMNENVFHVLDGTTRDTISVKIKKINEKKNEWIAGLGLLSRYDLIIDLHNMKSYFTRNDIDNWFDHLFEVGFGYGNTYGALPLWGEKEAVVLYVDNKSVLFNAGLRNYDIITAFGNHSFYDKDDYLSYCKAQGDSVVLHINRWGTPLKVKYLR